MEELFEELSERKPKGVLFLAFFVVLFFLFGLVFHQAFPMNIAAVTVLGGGLIAGALSLLNIELSKEVKNKNGKENRCSKIESMVNEAITGYSHAVVFCAFGKKDIERLNDERINQHDEIKRIALDYGGTVSEEGEVSVRVGKMSDVEKSIFFEFRRNVIGDKFKKEVDVVKLSIIKELGFADLKFAELFSYTKTTGDIFPDFKKSAEELCEGVDAVKESIAVLRRDFAGVEIDGAEKYGEEERKRYLNKLRAVAREGFCHIHKEIGSRGDSFSKVAIKFNFSVAVIVAFLLGYNISAGEEVESSGGVERSAVVVEEMHQ